MEPIEEERYERVDREPGRPLDPAAREGYRDPAYEGTPAEREAYYRRSGGTVVRTYNYTAERIVWFVVAFIDALVAIRFFMRLLGASYDAPFVRFIYGITDPLVAPFRHIFPPAGQGNFILEPESLIAIVIYLLIGWAVVALIRILTAPRGRRAPF
jgi:uncharacterized protein YggT (Ycf19 family)